MKLSSYLIPLVLIWASLDTNALVERRGDFLERDPYIGVSCADQKNMIFGVLVDKIRRAVEKNMDDTRNLHHTSLFFSLQSEPTPIEYSLQKQRGYIIKIVQFFADGSWKTVLIESMGLRENFRVKEAVIRIFPNGKINPDGDCEK